MTNGMRSIRYFLLGFVAMLLLFGGITLGLSSVGVVLDASGLYILFALQQLLTLGVLYWSLGRGGRKGVDAFIAYLDERNQRKGRGLFWKWVVGGFVVYMIGNGLLFSLVQYMGWTIPGLYGDQGVMTMLQEMNITGTMDWFMTALMIVIVGPIVEEVVYRGLITDALMQRRRWGGVIVAAFVFALIHMEFAVFWNLFMLALLLGVIYYKTGSMRYSFLFHLIINGMGILVLWLNSMGYVPEM